MVAVKGRVQREGEVVHLVAHRVRNFSPQLATLGQRHAACPQGGGGARRRGQGGAPGPRASVDYKVLDIHVRGRRVETIKVTPRSRASLTASSLDSRLNT